MRKKTLFLALAAVLGAVHCGSDDLDLVGQPCSDGRRDGLACLSSFSTAKTWEKTCWNHRDCPDHVFCVVPPYSSGGIGVCDLGNRWSTYSLGANTMYITGANPGYWGQSCSGVYSCGSYFGCEMVYGFSYATCQMSCYDDIDCLATFGSGSFCVDPYIGAGYGYCQPAY